MKIQLVTLSLAVLVVAVSCSSPVENRQQLASPINKSELKYQVTQKSGEDNIVYLKSETPGVIPFWDWGSGSSTNVKDSVIFPFSGSYVIHYNVNSAGGFVKGDSTTVKVTTTNLKYLQDPEWGYLTNGQTGKTWVLDMTKPIGWYGYDYLKHNGSADDWSWHPDYAGNEWVMPNRDYGQMTFDLDNGKNYSRTYIDDSGKATTTTGSFDMDLANHTISLHGADMLYGGDYYSQATNWRKLTILSLTDSTMTLAVNRDNPNPGDGPCWIGFTFVPKK